ncbi:XRE family transcriptional regulator [Sesbania bispinosa]|nr:XRE family transcriptional regulator [Sesbania bispinosa]
MFLDGVPLCPSAFTIMGGKIGLCMVNRGDKAYSMGGAIGMVSEHYRRSTLGCPPWSTLNTRAHTTSAPASHCVALHAATMRDAPPSPPLSIVVYCAPPSQPPH